MSRANAILSLGVVAALYAAIVMAPEPVARYRMVCERVSAAETVCRPATGQAASELSPSLGTAVAAQISLTATP